MEERTVVQPKTCLIRKLQKSDKICNAFHTQPTAEPQVNKYMEDSIKPPSIFSILNYINYGFSC